ncbi:3-hydroxyacyl-CoA dehydrogenase [Dyadobacter psychrophilus]|uniref:NAD(P)-dependent dehydrogenase, short-chain alcohol dehydrogenase family n=1 Tax=Dyadobacter psychrophilus TaxID=651661 RepID=A0A1T5CH60_9BACT|nr:3-hydroxyacyl-CoA dehydrogenase [Dyadobacter psychrophilus]SKB58808.1 NAD(P)-dependent dehydrogenase, short-chain alcohol dehydrogenase family [Dyadobacter psychrophilus]
MQLQKSTALITGGASGLGEATARLFVESGANVVVLDLNVAAGEKLQSEFPDKIKFVKTDVSSESDVQKAVDLALETFGFISIAVNCAGIAPARKIVGKADGIYGPHSFDLFEKTIKTNLIGTFNVMRLAAFAMEKNTPNDEGERGVIINTASVAAFDGQMGQVAYAASKGGIVSMTLPVARDLAKSGIRVMAIAPGLFETPLMLSLPEEARISLGQQIPFPSRLGRPSEYALLAKSIVENPMLNGEVIRLDGAIRMSPK